jgi:hypothetical protein
LREGEGEGLEGLFERESKRAEDCEAREMLARGTQNSSKKRVQAMVSMGTSGTTQTGRETKHP